MSFVDVQLGDLAEVIRGITFPTTAKRKQAADGLVACLRTTNVQETVEWDDLLYVPEAHVKNQEQYVREGDILVSMSNSLDLVGKCALVGRPERAAAFGAFIAVVRVRDGVQPNYLFHAMRSPAFRAYVRDVASTTTNISNINSSKLLAAPVRIYGKRTSKAIASKIDELFSRIDEGERALEQVSTLVERYRQSVLKAAVTGELTRDWRAARKARGEPVESGESLLARILTARRQAWEQAELAKMKAKGIKPANENWKKKYKEPAPPDTSHLPELPEGWVWASLPLLCGIDSTNGISVKGSNTPPGVPALRLDAMGLSRFDYSARRYIPIDQKKAQRLLIRSGDFFVSRANGSLALVGRAVLAQEPPDRVVFPDTMIRYRMIDTPDCRAWLASIWGSRFVRDQIERKAKTTAGIYKISQEDISEIVIPVPPVGEQEVALSLIDECLSQVSGMVTSLRSSEKASLALKQAILKQAFSGQLLPQDPTDEPAPALLERIAAERDTPTTVAPKRGRRKKPA